MSNTLFTSNVCFICGYYSKVPKVLNMDPYWDEIKKYEKEIDENKIKR